MRLRPLRRQDGHARPARRRYRCPRVVAWAIAATLGGAVLSPAALAADARPASAAIAAQRARAVPAASDLGASGPQVRFLQRRLFDERYAVPLSGFFDAATGRAVVAFRKVNDLPRVTYASHEVMSLLAAGRGAYRVRYRHQGRHAEGDLTHQVLALVRADGRLWRVYETSSGRAALPTPIGRFHIYRQEYGLNSHDELDMSYFKGICGIHGYFVVPTHAQSHCCLRVPLADALAVRDFLHVGDAVLTFRRGRAAASRLG